MRKFGFSGFFSGENRKLGPIEGKKRNRLFCLVKFFFPLETFFRSDYAADVVGDDVDVVVVVEDVQRLQDGEVLLARRQKEPLLARKRAESVKM